MQSQAKTVTAYLMEAPAERKAAVKKLRDRCPVCGEAAVVNEEGCPGNLRPKCYACKFSECS